MATSRSLRVSSVGLGQIEAAKEFLKVGCRKKRRTEPEFEFPSTQGDTGSPCVIRRKIAVVGDACG